MSWLVEQGAKVFIPIGHSPDYDLIADFGDRLVRVQVKTSRRLTPHGRFQVMLETKGGNQSWNGVVRRFDRSRYDSLFVLVADGRRWFIPSDRIEGTSGICLGGTKYGEFEVASGRPFPDVREPRR